MEPVDPLHQLANRVDDRVELDADRSVFAGRFDDDREREVVREIQPAAERAREHRRMDAVELEDLLRDRLVLRVEQAVRAGTGEALVEQFEVGGETVVRGVVAGERFGEVEDEIDIQLREAVQALDRSVEDVAIGLVTEFAQRLGDFVLDFFLVEGARERRLVGGCGLFGRFPAIVEDGNLQCAQSAGIIADRFGPRVDRLLPAPAAAPYDDRRGAPA